MNYAEQTSSRDATHQLMPVSQTRFFLRELVRRGFLAEGIWRVAAGPRFVSLRAEDGARLKTAAEERDVCGLSDSLRVPV